MSCNYPSALREIDIMPFDDLKIFRTTSNLRTAMCGGLNFRDQEDEDKRLDQLSILAEG